MRRYYIRAVRVSEDYLADFINAFIEQVDASEPVLIHVPPMITDLREARAYYNFQGDKCIALYKLSPNGRAYGIWCEGDSLEGLLDEE